jgi:hypothetical protein
VGANPEAAGEAARCVKCLTGHERASSQPASTPRSSIVLERRGARGGLNKSRLAERHIDEGMRLEDHPGIVFRDGPAGRRAGLAAGPDVWEVIAATRASGLADAAEERWRREQDALG